MPKYCAEKFRTSSLNTKSDAKPTYETILQKLNAVSCAHVTLREPINKNKTNNNNQMENTTNKNNDRWRDCAEIAVCDTPTRELDAPVQQRVYRNQQYSQQQSPATINSSIEKLVRTFTQLPYTQIPYFVISNYRIYIGFRFRVRHIQIPTDTVVLRVRCSVWRINNSTCTRIGTLAWFWGYRIRSDLNLLRGNSYTGAKQKKKKLKRKNDSGRRYWFDLRGQTHWTLCREPIENSLFLDPEIKALDRAK